MELNFQELLSEKKGNFYLVSSRERDIDIFKRQSMMDTHSNFVMRVLRGQRCTSKYLLFHEFAAALQFPYYFGHNWDAFDECIVDLSWLPAEKYFLFVTNFEELLSNNPHDLKVFFIIMKDTIVQWTKENRNNIPSDPAAFNILFHCEPENEKKCLEILEKHNIKPVLRHLKPFDAIK